MDGNYIYEEDLTKQGDTLYYNDGKFNRKV